LVAAKLAAAAREQVDRRVDRRAGELRVPGSLLDARGCNLLVGFLAIGPAHECVELRLAERREPSRGRRAGGLAARHFPRARHLDVRQRQRADFLRLRWRLQRAPRHRQHDGKKREWA
jgi:hypothetical protein